MPKLEKDVIGVTYLASWFVTILGLLWESPVLMVAGTITLIYTFYSDDYDENHIDPPDTVYINDAGDTYTANRPVQEQIP